MEISPILLLPYRILSYLAVSHRQEDYSLAAFNIRTIAGSRQCLNTRQIGTLGEYPETNVAALLIFAPTGIGQRKNGVTNNGGISGQHSLRLIFRTLTGGDEQHSSWKRRTRGMPRISRHDHIVTCCLQRYCVFTGSGTQYQRHLT